MKKIRLLSFLLFCNYCIKAQPAVDNLHEKKIYAELLSIDDGLSQGNIQGIVQDKNGFMWFGTNDGLNKYDGYRVTIYRHDEKNPYSISSNHVVRLVADPRGFLWLTYVDRTMGIFNPETERAYSFDKNAIKNPMGSFLIIDTSGIRYFTDGVKLLKIQLPDKPGSFSANMKMQWEDLTKYLPEKTNDTNYCYVFISSKNEMYISYRDSVFVYPDADITRYNKARRFSNNHFAQQKPNKYFEGVCAEDTVHDRLICKSRDSFTLYDKVKGIKADSVNFTTIVYGINFDRKGRLWINTYTNILLYDPAGRQLLKLVSGNSSIREDVFNSINSSYVDRSGVTWIATSAYGVLRYNLARERFATFDNKEGRFSLCGIWDDYHANRIWAYSYGKSNFLFDKSLQQLIDIPESFKTKFAKAFGLKTNPWSYSPTIFVDPNGYWMAYDSIVIYFDKEMNVVSRNKMNYLLRFWDIKTQEDKQGNLWMATGHYKDFELHKFDKNTHQLTNSYTIPVTEKINNYPFTNVIMPDENNNVWLGTLNGLYCFNTSDAKWKHYAPDDKDVHSLPIKFIFTLCNDILSKNTLWIGTNGGGLVKFDKTTGKCVTFTTREGLPNNVIYGILLDKNGNLWMSTNNGLSRFNQQTNSFDNYTVKDGLQGNEFNGFAYSELQNGELAFGGVNGLNIFNPDDIIDNPYQPNILFTEFKIGNKEVSISDTTKILGKSIFATRELHLDYTQNYITFSFMSSDYSAIEKNSFQYQLVDLDKDWQPATKLNEATYTNLDPGTYTFKVRGTNSDGIWSRNEASVNIFISPPWWATWWFRCLMVITVAAATYSFYRYRLMQALKIANVRNSIAQDLHDEIGSTLSSIALYGESAKMMLPDENPVSNVLSKITESTRNMNESMSDIVWAINTRNDQSDNLVSRMEAFANQVMEPRACKVFFETNNEVQQLELNMEQRKNLYLLYKEIVSNAGKHSGCKNLWVKLNLNNSFLNLNIKDDGKGFNPDESNGYSMGGNGLFNIKKRASDLHAEIKIDSVKGMGTEVMLKIRL